MSTELADRLRHARQQLETEIAKAVIGQQEPVELLLVSLLCEGHALLLGVPGVGKTLLAATLARVLDLEFQRIQFTPDLMPGDVTGSEIIEEDAATGRQVRAFVPGPIFANLLLADEVNRTAPKTQSALLQAMQEREVTAARKTYTLKRPFMVLATQNPLEHEGTYPLPEAQLDRFMFCIRMGYPSPSEEAAIVKSTTGAPAAELTRLFTAAEVVELQRLVRTVPVADDVVDYAVRLATMTRNEGGNGSTPPGIARYVSCGASPRASQNLILGGKARALWHGRYSVDFADLRALAAPVLRHRLLLNYKARADKVSADDIIAELVKSTPEESRR
ncbi:MAG: MoxR family ATPase [Chthoniobacteraceae bacterium]